MSSSSGSQVIVVVGCTGNQGSSVVRALLAESGQYRIRGICRRVRTEKAREMKKRGVELVKCDVGNKEDVMAALQGAYAVFAATQFWQEPILENPELEFQQGKNIVDACIANKVQHFIWSSLDDSQSISKGKYKVPTFTNKNRVETYAKKQTTLNCTFLCPSSYYENLLPMVTINRQKLTGELSHMCNEHTKIPMFSVEDMGKIVVKVIDWKGQYLNKRILVACELLSFVDVVKIFSEELDMPIKYRRMNEKEHREEYGDELTEMYKYIDEFGYFQDLENTMGEAKKIYPNMKSLRSWIKENKYYFIPKQSMK